MNSKMYMDILKSSQIWQKFIEFENIFIQFEEGSSDLKTFVEFFKNVHKCFKKSSILKTVYWVWKIIIQIWKKVHSIYKKLKWKNKKK